MSDADKVGQEMIFGLGTVASAVLLGPVATVGLLVALIATSVAAANKSMAKDAKNPQA